MGGEKIYSIGYMAAALQVNVSHLQRALAELGFTAALEINDVPHFTAEAFAAVRVAVATITITEKKHG